DDDHADDALPIEGGSRRRPRDGDEGRGVRELRSSRRVSPRAAREPVMSIGGLSKTRLGRLHDVMAGYVERGDVPGIVTLVSRRGEVHVDAIGTKAVAGSDPIRRDTIFRIASLTKPIAAAATMILVEQCGLRLDEPANRPITVRDLLTFRAGYGIVMAPPGTYPIQTAMSERLLGQGPPKPQTPPAPDEWIRRLGTLPLMHQPGEQWMYHTASDVLGVLIARASGQPLETFLRERLFEPLGMKDAGFSVPAARLDRLATSYQVDPKTRALELYDAAKGGEWSRPPAFPSAGGGLVCTIDDYLAFGQMMLNHGKDGGGRNPCRPSVQP